MDIEETSSLTTTFRASCPMLNPVQSVVFQLDFDLFSGKKQNFPKRKENTNRLCATDAFL